MKKKYKIQCAECKMIFYNNNSDRKYCSPACSHVAQHAQLEDWNKKHKISYKRGNEPKYITLKNGLEVKNDILGKTMNSQETITI